MPVYVDVHKMAVDEVQRCWNVLDKTRGLCSMGAFAAYLRADSDGRRDGEGGVGLAIFARRFTAG
jgi:hypothetical protein